MTRGMEANVVLDSQFSNSIRCIFLLRLNQYTLTSMPWVASRFCLSLLLIFRMAPLSDLVIRRNRQGAPLPSSVSFYRGCLSTVSAYCLLSSFCSNKCARDVKLSVKADGHLCWWMPKKQVVAFCVVLVSSRLAHRLAVWIQRSVLCNLPIKGASTTHRCVVRSRVFEVRATTTSNVSILFPC